MKKKILFTMMTASIISSALAMPAYNGYGDPKMPNDKTSMETPMDTLDIMRPSTTMPMPRSRPTSTPMPMPRPTPKRFKMPRCLPPMPRPDEADDHMNMIGTNTIPMMPPMIPMSSSTMMIGSTTSLPNLGMGDGTKNGKGRAVRALQRHLIETGFMTGTTTGNFGALTKDAVKKYQKSIGVSNASGYFGSVTREKIQMTCQFIEDQKDDRYIDNDIMNNNEIKRDEMRMRDEMRPAPTSTPARGMIMQDGDTVYTTGTPPTFETGMPPKFKRVPRI